MVDGLLAMIWTRWRSRRRIEPEAPRDAFGTPVLAQDVADERYRGRTGTSLSVSHNFFHEASVFGSFAIVKWGRFQYLPRCEPN